MEHWVFGDESGNFDFSEKGTRYFIVGTLNVASGHEQLLRDGLHDLRRALAEARIDHDGVFHAAEDRQQVRDLVFPVIINAGPTCDVTILEKRKAYPKIRQTDEQFYKYAWYYHLRHLLRNVGRRGDTVHIVLADIGTKAKRAAFRTAAEEVLRQCARSGVSYNLATWKAASDVGLQAVDYVLWAVRRRLELDDERSYLLVKHLLKTEFHLFGT
ncbi:MAG: DUF3800 domain-containing protein [Deltaproteobacteria bacterium]